MKTWREAVDQSTGPAAPSPGRTGDLLVAARIHPVKLKWPGTVKQPVKRPVIESKVLTSSFIGLSR